MSNGAFQTLIDKLRSVKFKFGTLFFLTKIPKLLKTTICLFYFI